MAMLKSEKILMKNEALVLEKIKKILEDGSEKLQVCLIFFIGRKIIARYETFYTFYKIQQTLRWRKMISTIIYSVYSKNPS